VSETYTDVDGSSDPSMAVHCTNTHRATIDGPVLALCPPNTPLRAGVGDR
jgi:hypothetical protein